MPSSDIDEFRHVLSESRRILIVSGAGLSAPSGKSRRTQSFRFTTKFKGIATFRGTSGRWRKYDANSLATLSAWYENQSRVWQFFHYRREEFVSCPYSVRGKSPNEAHRILARLCTPSLCKNVAPNAERVTHVTQNVDGLSLAALSAVSGLSSSESIIEMHGNLFNVACTAHDCSYTSKNTDNPICPALGGTEKIVEEGNTEPIVKRALLPHCPEKGCGQLLRPDVVWFGERPKHIEKIIELAKEADLCLVVGTSSLVQPASRLPEYVRANGGKVAVFNMERTNHSDEADWVFLGGCEVELGRVLGL